MAIPVLLGCFRAAGRMEISAAVDQFNPKNHERESTDARDRRSHGCGKMVLRIRVRCCNLLTLQGAPVAQLDRAFDYESKGRMFESCRAHIRINNLQANAKMLAMKSKQIVSKLPSSGLRWPITILNRYQAMTSLCWRGICCRLSSD